MIEQTISKLQKLKLNRMAECYRNQMSNPNIQGLSFDERMAILVDLRWMNENQRRSTN